MDLSQFTISGEREYIKSLSLQNARLIKLRWFFITSLPLIAALASFLAKNPTRAKIYILICLAGLTLNGILFLLCRFLPKIALPYQLLMVAQIGIDIGLATVATYVTGGPLARTTAIYALPIVSAGLIFSRSMVLFTAILSGVSYIGCVWLYVLNHQIAYDSYDLLVPVVFYPAFFIILAQLTIYMTKKATVETQEKAYDAFLALLSHQLKHPTSTANAIIDQLEYSRRKSRPLDSKFIQMLKSENQNLSILLNNLLETASAPVNTSRDQVDLPSMVQQIAHHCAEDHKRIPDLKLKLYDMSLEILGNAERLKTAIANVLNNAFLYSTSGTPVSIELRTTPVHVILTVEDVSTISKQTKRHLFKKFNVSERTEYGIRGLGLGLYVARKIIRSHQGNLHIVSDKTSTKVIITLKRS